MAFKSSLQHRRQGRLQEMSRAELEEQLDGDEVSAKMLAIPHVERSIKTLVRSQRHRLSDKQLAAGETLAPHMVRRQAAKDLIDIAHGRPETRHPDDKTAGAGLTVIIERLTIGPSETVVSAVDIARNVQEAIDVTPQADSVPSGVESSPGEGEDDGT